MVQPAGPQQPQSNTLDELRTWYSNIPPITRALFTTYLAMAIGVQFGLVDPHFVALIPQMVLKKFQVWRLVTNLFVSGLNMGFLFNLYFLYNNAIGLERGYFANRKADFIWFLLVSFLITDVCLIIFYYS